MRKAFAFILTLAVMLTLLATPVFAQISPGRTNLSWGNQGWGCPNGGMGGGWMWDDNGNFLDKEAFGERIDKAVEDGLITAEDRDYLLEMYEWCIENGWAGGRGRGVRGGCSRGGWRR
ncbi:MAG: hypothetical protein FWG94_11115 [Oscillospiraceae bacterium]|nr:hypothetical protein [Oscillospiraceae bacterium]